MENMKLTLKEIVAQRLSAAPDSTAKTELIEELSDNLFCRYADLTESGVESEEAKARAVDALGDTDELVEYLKGLEPDQPLPELLLDPDKEDGGQIEEILLNVEDILRGAFRKAKSAFKDAKETVKEGLETEEKTDAAADADVVSDAEREKKVAELEAAMAEKEREKTDLEAAIEEKKQKIEAAREALSELEDARDALEAVSDRVVVEKALEDVEEKISAKEAEIDSMEEELDGMEEACDALEEEYDALEEQLDELEDGESRSWKVTYHSKKGHNVEIDADSIKCSMKDMMKDIEKVIRDATGVAKDAAKDACKMAKDAADKVYGDVSADTLVETDKPIDAAQLRGIDVQTVGGDITILMTQEPDGDVLVSGDTEDIEVSRSADGVLIIRPVKNETTSFFFGRGIFSSSSSADVKLELPRRSWEFLKLTTTTGDIRVEGVCPVDAVNISSVGGDVCGALPSCGKLTCRTTGSDIRWTGDVSDCHIESIGGDVQFRGASDKVSAKTTSGDLTLEGGICDAGIRTVSGDVCLRSHVMPDAIGIATTSGDMWVDIPDAGPFTARFRSTSGDFTSDFFTGKMGGRSCVFNYQGGGERNYTFTSISGDVEIRKYR